MMGCDDLSSLVVFVAVSFLIVLLFRAVGVVHLRTTLARLQQKYRYSRQDREEHRIFENLQLRFRQVHDHGQWWQAVREAASRLDFVWISLKKDVRRRPHRNGDLAGARRSAVRNIGTGHDEPSRSRTAAHTSRRNLRSPSASTDPWRPPAVGLLCSED